MSCARKAEKISEIILFKQVEEGGIFFEAWPSWRIIPSDFLNGFFEPMSFTGLCVNLNEQTRGQLFMGQIMLSSG